MVKYCPRCGYANPDTASFCLRCGYPLYASQNQYANAQYQYSRGPNPLFIKLGGLFGSLALMMLYIGGMILNGDLVSRIFSSNAFQVVPLLSTGIILMLIVQILFMIVVIFFLISSIKLNLFAPKLFLIFVMISYIMEGISYVLIGAQYGSGGVSLIVGGVFSILFGILIFLLSIFDVRSASFYVIYMLGMISLYIFSVMTSYLSLSGSLGGMSSESSSSGLSNNLDPITMLFGRETILILSMIVLFYVYFYESDNLRKILESLLVLLIGSILIESSIWRLVGLFRTFSFYMWAGGILLAIGILSMIGEILLILTGIFLLIFSIQNLRATKS